MVVAALVVHQIVHHLPVDKVQRRDGPRGEEGDEKAKGDQKAVPAGGVAELKKKKEKDELKFSF